MKLVKDSRIKKTFNKESPKHVTKASSRGTKFNGLQLSLSPSY